MLKQDTISGLKCCFLLWSNVGGVKRDVRVAFVLHCKMYSECVECCSRLETTPFACNFVGRKGGV